MEPVIDVKKLVKKYGDLTAVNGISFSVQKGEIFGLLGENGAGKTTTLEIIEGLRKPTDGEVFIMGHSVRENSTVTKEHIGVQLQSSAYYSYLTLEEILRLFGTFYGRTVDPTHLLEMVDLTKKAKSYVTDLSGGQRQRFSIVASLVNDPDIVFLDEPTTGLDPVARRNLWGIITKIREQGKTVVLTTHYLEEAELLCDRIAIMNKGEIVAMDKTSRLIQKAKYPYSISFEATTNEAEVLKELEHFGTVEHQLSRAHTFIARIKSEDNLSKAIALVQKTKPEGLTVRPASLEDLFIELTGKTIHHGEDHAE